MEWLTWWLKACVIVWLLEFLTPLDFLLALLQHSEIRSWHSHFNANRPHLQDSNASPSTTVLILLVCSSVATQNAWQFERYGKVFFFFVCEHCFYWHIWSSPLFIIPSLALGGKIEHHEMLIKFRKTNSQFWEPYPSPSPWLSMCEVLSVPWGKRGTLACTVLGKEKRKSSGGRTPTHTIDVCRK